MKKIHTFHDIAFAASTLLILGGCASPEGALPSRSKSIDPLSLEVKSAINNSAISNAAWPEKNWWDRYGDAQLNSLVEQALEGTPTINLAQARVRQAQAMAFAAESNRDPQINASLKETRQRYSKHSTVPPPLAGTWQTLNDVSISLNWDLDFWSKNEDAISASLDRLHAAEVDEQAARLYLAIGITQSYFRLAAYYDQLDLWQTVLQQRLGILDLTIKRVSAGIDSQVELKQAESTVPSTRQQLAAIQENIELTRNQISVLAGKSPDFGLTLIRPKLKKSNKIGVPENLAVNLIGRRPDIVAMRWRVEAARQEIGVAKKHFLPNVSLMSFIGFQSLGFDQFLDAGSRTIGVGPAISLPMFDGGRLRANLGARNSEYDIFIEQYNESVINAVQDVVNQLTSIRWHDAQHDEQWKAVETARVAYQLAAQRYKAGVGTYLQVLTADLQLAQQRKTLLDIDSEAMQLDVNLIRSLGGGALEP